MELWIRTQDRTTLVKCNNEIYIAEMTNSYLIREVGALHTLGAYKTIDRALEVLDEIQKILKPMMYTEKGKIVGMINNEFIKEKGKAEVIELSTYVYEMPKE